jgi:hypothetical protein
VRHLCRTARGYKGECTHRARQGFDREFDSSFSGRQFGSSA